MKVSDFIAQFLFEQGTRHVFVVSGGAIIHSIDSVAKHPGMKYICVQHEQAVAAAADAYSRLGDAIGVGMVTSGPGATNLTTSICNAYFDSIPCLFICGQVTTPRLRPNQFLRQKGFQETDIVSLFASITKYVHRLMDPYQIKFELQKAIVIAKSDRPGPVVLDIPDDLQRMEIDPSKLTSFISNEDSQGIDPNEVSKVKAMVQESKRPVLILGAGIRIAHARESVLAFARAYKIPILLTWGGKDLLSFDDELNLGGLGVVGPRSGNFAAQNADLIIAAGTRLSQMITGGKTILFAPFAQKVLVDIDEYELTKFTSNDFHLDLGIKAELGPFFTALLGNGGNREDRFKPWRERIRAWEREYPICPKEKYDRQEYVDGHVFVKELSHAAIRGDVFIGDTGANLSWVLQAIELKEDQRIFSAWNHTPMGYAVSASVGAIAAGSRRVLCLTGDGGLMMNLQELATIKRYNMNVKVFIFNNDGHAIQKQTIDTWLNSHYAAVDTNTGLSFPDFVKTAEAFHLPVLRIENHSQLKGLIQKALDTPGPFVCDIMIDPCQKIEPMLKFGAGLEDLNPKLDSQEIKTIMKVSSNG